MSLISTWSTVADSNGTLGSPPFFWPEGQAPSTVNDCARLMMASIRTQFNELPWFNWGYNVTRASGTSIQITTASANTVTIAAVFYTGGRLKFFDTSTLYGTITTVSSSAVATTVSFTPDAGSLTASFTSVHNSILNDPTGSGLSIPSDVVRQSGAQIYGADAGATDAYAISLSPTISSLTTGQMINFKANTANTGAATLSVNGLPAVSIVKNGGDALDTGDIDAGQIITVIYDGTNFQMQSPTANATTSGIIQVVSTKMTDTLVAVSASPHMILPLTITPTSNTSRILVTGSVAITMLNSQGQGFLSVCRNNSVISGSIGDSAGNRTCATTMGFPDEGIGINAQTTSVNYLDSPGTTDTITYAFGIFAQSGSIGIYINRSPYDSNEAGRPRLISTITLMEVAG